MDFDIAAKEAYTTSLQHGFWDGECDAREKIALIHSEFSEALEEARNNRPMTYPNPDKPGKMEGVAVELIDAVIRMLDFMGRYNVKYVQQSERFIAHNNDDAAPIFICKLHAVLSDVLGYADDGCGIDISTGMVCDLHTIGWAFSNIIDEIFVWLRTREVDPEIVLMQKAEYNKSRPYKHGKQF